MATTATAANATPPTISSISPNNGAASGGTSVTITGSNFITGSTVKFGSTSAAAVSIKSSTSIVATSPAGSGTAGVSVTNSGGTSAATPYDQFAYDPAPTGAWLGLNGNSSTYLGPVDAFVEHSIVYDRSGAIEWEAGQVPKAGDGLSKDIEDGMTPDITIEYSGYPGCEWGHECLPSGTAITTYVTGFVKSAEAVLKEYPGKGIVFEPINEPYGYGTAAQYAGIIAKLLPEAEKAGIPLSDIYVAAYGKHWVPKMYEAQSKLETEVQGWYFHPYGPAKGTASENSEGIQSLPFVQAEMTSGQNNIIASEVGYCPEDVHGGEDCHGDTVANSTIAAADLTEMLDNALPYHQAGWLRDLIVYSRNDGGWAMQLEEGSLTKQGEALDSFADSYGLGWWSIQSTPNPAGGPLPLRGVSCASSTMCIAVGGTGDSSSSMPLAEKWNGVEWKMQSPSGPPGGSWVGLDGVSCSGESACTAVGGYGSGGGVSLAFRWNGTTWALQSTSIPSSTAEGFEGVSCPSATSCTAVGYYRSEESWKPLVEHWAGSEWSLQSTPELEESEYGALHAISCTSSSYCIAVGENQRNESIRQLAEEWNGKEWSIVSTTPSETWLNSVSCSAENNCMGVGSYSTGATSISITEHWNGVSWSTQSAPSPSELGSKLTDVSCTSSTSCSAVGYYVSSEKPTVVRPYAELWNGYKWLMQSVPNPTGYYNYLDGVSCLTETECTAVGMSTHEGGYATLAERFSG